VVEEGIRQLAEEPVDAGGVLLLAFPAVVLEIGVSGEAVEAVDLGLMTDGSQRTAVGGDGEGHVALAGFDDVLGEVAPLVVFVEDETDGLGVAIGGKAFGDGAADEGGCVDRRWWGGLAAGGRGQQEWQDRAGEKDGARKPG
jgi:hypothetical protein